ncbi:hypothetical protein PVL29_012643 [Vitis rotundifolia]|uniref:Gnk2-homologous domain-containing protein n=1 Tax=Vitis rotundifolia TaxID=103349 RepID=A0AA38ZJ92_VITRO|nr:hypothetical protein PVL29_012643 [Vitis rotundifolia]
MGCLGLVVFISSIQMHLLTIALGQNFLRQFCMRERGNYTNNSAYQANLDSLLSAFCNTTVDYGFYNSSAGEVKAIALCRGDLTPNTCRKCIGTSSHELRGLCPNYKEAYIYYDNCMLGYSNRSIFSINKLSPIYISAKLENFSDVNQTNQVLPKLLGNLKDEAASGSPLRKYAVGEATVGFETIYALVQCTPDLQKQQCTNCLDDLNVLIPKNFSEGKNGLTAIGPICNFRYEVYRFYQSRPDAPSSFPSPTGDAPSPAASNDTTGNGMQLNLHACFEYCRD